MMGRRRTGWIVVAACASAAACSPGAALEPIADTIASLQRMIARESAGIVGGQVTPLWLDGGARFLFSESGDRDLRILLATSATGQARVLTEDRMLRASLAKATGLESSNLRAKCVGLSRDSRTLFLEVDSRIFAVDVRTLEVRAAPEWDLEIATARPRVISNQFPTTFGNLVEAASPDGRRFITVKDHNLYVRSAGNDSLHALTSDGSERMTWLNTQESAQSFNVHWSPDARHIAAVQLDTRDVWYEPLPHWLGARSEAGYAAYPRAGEPMHRFKLSVLDVDNGSRVEIETGDTRDKYVDLLGWRSDGRAVYYQTIDREQKELRILSADSATGKPVEVLREGRSTYLDTRMTLGIDFFFALKRSNGFVYLSERDGWRHLYLYDQNGKLIRRLTEGTWPVSEVMAIDEPRGWIYFRASQDSATPYDLQLFRVPLRGGRVEKLTAGAGHNDVSMAPDIQFFVTRSSAPDAAPVAELRATNGHLIATLSRADVAKLTADGYAGTERLVAPSVDGRWQVHGIIVKPYHFDEAARFPVVEIIYGGMQMTNTPRGFYFHDSGSSLILRSLVNAGFAVVVSDAPGTPGRSREFQDVTYGTWPQGVIDNHVHWIKAAARTRPWMDLSRVGVYGHSWGGYMAERAMIDAPDFYKAAVEHAGPADFVDHPTYIEPFMGLPQNNRAGYAAGSNLARIDAIRGPVLVMAMPLDVNAGFTPGMKFYDAMIRARKDVDLVVFPDGNHRMNCCGVDRELYATALVQRYFRSHLQQP